MMIEIKLEETYSLKFGMEIEGDARGNAEMRFSIINEGMRYSFDANPVGQGLYEVEFPRMLGKIDEGIYDAEVEIIIGGENHGKHFVPVTQSVKFVKEVRPVVKLAEQVKQVEKKTAVKVKLGEVSRVVKIDNAKALLESVQDGDKVQTDKMLTGLVTLAQEGKLSEKEALAAIKMIEFYGTDLDTLPNVAALTEMSQRVSDDLIPVLRDKGISTNKLKSAGLI